MNTQKTQVVKTIREYFDAFDSASEKENKANILCSIYEYIDTHFDYIRSNEFDPNKRFITTVHEKCIEHKTELDGISSSLQETLYRILDRVQWKFAEQLNIPTAVPVSIYNL